MCPLTRGGCARMIVDQVARTRSSEIPEDAIEERARLTRTSQFRNLTPSPRQPPNVGRFRIDGAAHFSGGPAVLLPSRSCAQPPFQCGSKWIPKPPLTRRPRCRKCESTIAHHSYHIYGPTRTKEKYGPGSEEGRTTATSRQRPAGDAAGDVNSEAEDPLRLPQGFSTSTLVHPYTYDLLAPRSPKAGN